MSMDLSKGKIHVIGYLSSALESMNRAKSLINLAEKNQGNAATLAACATVLLAASLEQAVKTRLSVAAKTIALEEDIDPLKTGPGQYLDTQVPFSARVRCLPWVLTEGTFLGS